MGDICIADAVNWDHSLNRGLVSWYLTLRGHNRGVVFRDLCMRNHGTLTNMDPATDWVAPFQGYNGRGWLDFDGTNDNVTIPDHSSLKGMPGLTLIATVYPRTSGGGGFARIITKNDTADYSLLINTTNGFQGTIGGTSATSQPPTAVGSICQVAMVYNGANIQIYRDSVASGSPVAKTGSVPSTTANVLIGDRAAGSRAFDGLIDDVRIYNRALSQSELSKYLELSRRRHPGLMNRVRLARLSVIEGAAVTAYPWHYYQQMMAG